MEMFVKCDRCGALVETTDEILGGMSVKCAPCAATTKVGSNDVVARDGCETTVLCQNCIKQLKKWLAGEPEKPQEAEDSAERLAADMARALACTPEDCCGIRVACEYFGHGGNTDCRDRESSLYGDKCPASGFLLDCCETMCTSIRRRCTALGIDLWGEADAK
jgi:hypothetical protein